MIRLVCDFKVTPRILYGIAEVSRRLGRFEGRQTVSVRSKLKSELNVQNLYGNLAMEGNTLSLSQIAVLSEGRHVPGMKTEVHEAKHAVHAYQRASRLDPCSLKNLLTIYLLLSEGDSSRSNKCSVHDMAHSKDAVVALNELFQFVGSNLDNHPILNAIVFHYNLIRIQPFSNRDEFIARLWHRLLLADFHPIFEHVPIEYIFRKRQQEYMDVLTHVREEDEQSTQIGLTEFMEFSLGVMIQGIVAFLDVLEPGPRDADSRLAFAKMHFGHQEVTRKRYMHLFKTIGPATASRDLKTGLEIGLLKKTGQKAQSKYYFTTG